MGSVVEYNALERAHLLILSNHAIVPGHNTIERRTAMVSILKIDHIGIRVKRMEAVGVKPITWNVVLAELQRDHARKDTEKETSRIFMEYLFKMDPDKGWDQ